MRINTRLVKLVGTALALLPLTSAGEISVDFGHNTEFSDNAFLSENNAVDKTEHRTWLEAGLEFESQNWQLDSEYRFTNVETTTDGDEDYPEEEEIAGTTRFNAFGLKQRVALDARHDRRVMYIQQGGRELPTNQQIRDTAAITPTVYMQNNSRQQIFLSANYTAIRYDSLSNASTTAINSDTTGISLTAQRELSGVDSAGFRLERDVASYDDDTFEDNQYTSLIGFYSAELRRISYQASLGINRVETDGLDTVTEPTASLGLNYSAGNTLIGFYTQYFITDSSRGNLAGTLFNIDPDAGEIGSGDARSVDRYTLISNRLTVDHSFSSRTLGALRFELANEDYQDRPELNQTNINLIGELSHSINTKWDVSMSARLRESNFERDGALENTTVGVNATTTYLASPRLSIRLDLAYRDRSSDRENLSFEEQAITLGFTYNLRP